MSAVDIGFLMQCRSAVRIMSDAGMSETMIACVVNDIRSAAISEEYQRVRALMSNAPPHHFTWVEMKDAIKA